MLQLTSSGFLDCIAQCRPDYFSPRFHRQSKGRAQLTSGVRTLAGSDFKGIARHHNASTLVAASWSEIDYKNKVWAVPPDRMKGKRAHRVPLSEAALEALE